MSMFPEASVSRRDLLAGTGALILSFSLARPVFSQGEEAQVTGGAKLPGSLGDYPFLDSWIRIGADDSITVLTGKAELGQGIKTALLQVAAEQLSVDIERITLLTADTDITPDEGFTAASHSMEESGMAIAHAAAQVRDIMLRLAAERLKVPATTLTVDNGVIVANGQQISYGKLVEGQNLHVRAQPGQKLKDPAQHIIMGKSLPRVDLAPKVTGGMAFVHDLRLPGMVHARVVRPPVPGAHLSNLDASDVEKMPGVVAIVRSGDFLAVVAEGEFQALRAMTALQNAAQWTEAAPFPEQSDIYDHLKSLRSEDKVIHETSATSGSPPAGATPIRSRYLRPYQMHGAIGPSCAVGLYQNGGLTVWSHTQGVYPDRDAIAQMLKMPKERVRLVHMEGAGCYGHNGADDAAADAALIAINLEGRPVRVQWMREDEHVWEPYGSAMIVETEGSVGSNGEITSWKYEVWSTPHATRPGGPGNLIAGALLPERYRLDKPSNIPQPAGGGDRNAVPGYNIPNARVVEHFIPKILLRVSALRSLGAYMNVFALESFMDELAEKSGADPVEFRLKYIEDERGRDVITRTADAFGWSQIRGGGMGRGKGFAYARYKNLAAYCAVAVELEVDHISGRVRILRAVASCDSGQVVNPDGIMNQVEGGMVQSASWTLYEQVRFRKDQILSRDWASYPIMRFASAPEQIEVHVIDRPGMPFLGTGEASQGPMAGALANAFANATGVRLRELPFSPNRVRTALRGWRAQASNS